MDDLFRDLNSLWALTAAVSVAIAAAAWALQMACGFCSVEPPPFTQAVVTVVIIVATNVVLRFGMQAIGANDGLAAVYLAPFLVVSTVIALALPTGPFTAVTITAVQVALCAAMYFVVGWFASVLTMTVYI